MVDDLRASGLTIRTVDTFGLFTAATANPAAFGLANLTQACLPIDPFLILQGVPVPTACSAPDRFLYWDKLHPTRVGHDALAATFDASVPAIPLPASALFLLAGLGAFAAVRRRTA
jgi:outer membrane lipase/esterase